MKTPLIFALVLSSAFVSIGPAQAEPRRKCDVDSNRLSGSFFLIAPDGRFCEASAEEERSHSQALEDQQRATEAADEENRAAQLAKYKAETRRAMIAGGASSAEADRAIAAATGAAAAQSASRAVGEVQQAGRKAAAAARQAATRASSPSSATGKCMGKSGKDGTPCLPVPKLSGIGNAIASRGLGY